MSDPLPESALERILDAVDMIEDCLGRLVEIRNATDRETYRADPNTQAIVERRFVTMTEAALDIGRVLIVHERGDPPETNPETMRTLSELEVLSDDVATEMVDAARFRNVLAHIYGPSIDHDLVYDALDDLTRYRDFTVEVRSYLEQIGALDPEA